MFFPRLDEKVSVNHILGQRVNPLPFLVAEFQVLNGDECSFIIYYVFSRFVPTEKTQVFVFTTNLPDDNLVHVRDQEKDN